MVALVRRKLVKVRVERLGRPKMEVAHVEITDAGRQALQS
jgi:hypothetical protein